MMRIDITAKELRRVLALLKPFIASRSALPVLRGVKVEVTKGACSFSVTDLEVGAMAEVNALAGGMAGTAILNYSDLAGFAKKATVPDDCTVRLQGDGEAEVRGKAQKRGTLETYDIGDYPADLAELPDKWWSGDVASFIRSAKAIATATSGDQARPLLCGINVKADGDVAATDSYRLAVAHFALDAGIETLIPARHLVAAAVKLNPVLLVGTTSDGRKGSTAPTYTWVIGDGAAVWIRNIDGAFPKYMSLLPDKGDIKGAWTFQSNQLVPILKDLPHQDHIPVVVDFEKGELSVTKDGKTATVPMVGKVGGRRSAEVPRMAFNGKYLVESIEAVVPDPKVGARVRMALISDLKPAWIFGPKGADGVASLLMPVRI